MNFASHLLISVGIRTSKLSHRKAVLLPIRPPLPVSGEHDKEVKGERVKTLETSLIKIYLLSVRQSGECVVSYSRNTISNTGLLNKGMGKGLGKLC